MGFIAWIVVGFLAGWLAGVAVMLVGGFLASSLGVRAQGGIIYTILVAVAVTEVVLVTWISRRITASVD